jgi:hypothetical protein
VDRQPRRRGACAAARRVDRDRVPTLEHRQALKLSESSCGEIDALERPALASLTLWWPSTAPRAPCIRALDLEA